jgi:SAM-dependent methyltransferase
MLKMAEVTSDDILYDLGCGDGRIVITAVKEFGAARGVGIDINPVRIKESNQNARKGEVEGRVKFIEQNLFEADIREATVVTLYLLPSVNLKLRPKLFRDLKPGTRIVSHSFDMGDWSADSTSQASGEYSYHSVYLWIMPANISGKWTFSITGTGIKEQISLEIAQVFQKANLVVSSGKDRTEIKDIKVKGDMLSFDISRTVRNSKESLRFTGIAKGDVLEGEVVFDSNPENVLRWSAARDPNTVTRIDPESDAYY